MPKTFSLHDTTIHTRDDDGSPDYSANRKLFHIINRLLRKNKFILGVDPHTHEHYRCLSSGVRRGRKGDLEVLNKHCGFTTEIIFFQNIVFDNPHGGEYDFSKLTKMSFLVRLSFQCLAAKIRKLLLQVGYEERLSGPNWVDDPLGAFNHGWDGKFEKKRGEHRFKRGPDGWPDESELRYWRYPDADGVMIKSGEKRYTIVNGRAFICKCYGGINGMWVAVYGHDKSDYTNKGAWEYCSIFPGRGRHFQEKQKQDSIRRDLAAAIRNKKFARADRISQFCEREGIEIEIKTLRVA